MIKLFVGTSGNNTLNGSGGADYMYADAGNDTLRGNGGTDFLRGSLGIDHLDGGDGTDVLDGGENNDTVLGGRGRDILMGLSGNDVINGGADNDTISGGLGADQLRGEAGADRFVFISTQDSTATAHDRILDFTAGDQIDLSGIDAKASSGGGQTFSYIGSTAFTAEGQIRASVQNGHTLVEVNTKGNRGAEMAIEVNGTSILPGGSFKLTGSVNNDDANHSVRLGSEGANSLSGGGGEDYVYGAGGNDTLRGGGDSDFVRGGQGNDIVDGGAGDDGLYGGLGADTFVATSGSDIIQDFEMGVDRIQAGAGFSQLAISQQADGALITQNDAATVQSLSATTFDDAGNSSNILLAGIDAGSLSATDFLFA